MKTYRLFFVISLASCLFAACGGKPGKQPEAISFSISGLDEKGILAADSLRYTTIGYSTNARDPVITFSLAADTTALPLYDSTDPVHPVSVYPTSGAEGQTFMVTAYLSDSDSRRAQAVFRIFVNKSEAEQFSEGQTPLAGLQAPDVMNINYTGYYPIHYTVTPDDLQNDERVTINYSVLTGGNGLEVFDSDHPDHPNTVRAQNNTAGSYTVAMRANAGGASQIAAFTVRVIGAESMTKNKNNRGGETLAQLALQFDDSALDNAYYVKPADNLSGFSPEYVDNFILGVDLSTLIEVENAGGKYYDADGYETGDVLELLSWYGVNWIRARIWHNPYHSVTGEPYGGGTNDLAKAIELSRRAKKWGMKFLLDFHYSDFWAHPGQQSRPKAWPRSNTGADAIAALLKRYTRDVLTAMAQADALPDMVQIGNETNSGIAGFSAQTDVNTLYAAGIAAVREVSAKNKYPIKIMLHATNGISSVTSFFSERAGLDYDVLGMSYYPMWHGSRSSFQSGLGQLARTFDKEICVVEYSSAYTILGGVPNGENNSESNANSRTFIDPDVTDRTIRAQAQVIRNLNSDIMNFAVNGSGQRVGIGSFWWEGAWLPLNGIAWAMPPSNEWYRMGLPGSSGTDLDMPGANPRVSWANQGFFSFAGTVMPSVNAFLQLKGRQPRPYTED